MSENTERKEREERFQAFIENSSDMITVLDPDGTYQYGSPSSTHVLGYEPDELPGKNVFEYVHPDDRGLVKETFSEAFMTPEMISPVEYRFKHKDGTWRWIESVGNNQLDNPVIEGFVVNSRDITERKQYEKHLEAQSDKLAVLNQMLRHDIRNYLQLVTAHSEMLRDRCQDQEALEHIEIVKENAEHAVNLTTTAREISEAMLTAGEELLKVRLGPILTGEIEKLRSTYPDAVIKSDQPFSVPPVRADEMLDTVFRNLFKNAVHHNDKDTPKIVVSATERTDSVIVRITDNGPGLPDNQKEEIFRKGENGQESQGTGIGLFLVQTLVKNYGGDMWVEDNEPEGATFDVELPIAG